MISRVRPYFCDDSPYFNFCVVLFLIYSRDVTNRRSIIGWSVHDLIWPWALTFCFRMLVAHVTVCSLYVLLAIFAPSLRFVYGLISKYHDGLIIGLLRGLVNLTFHLLSSQDSSYTQLRQSWCQFRASVSSYKKTRGRWTADRSAQCVVRTGRLLVMIAFPLDQCQKMVPCVHAVLELVVPRSPANDSVLARCSWNDGSNCQLHRDSWTAWLSWRDHVGISTLLIQECFLL